ncbi:CpaD family pilus assembly protein [Sphingomonas sp. GB1N7]|uniref:CpaD family pilus assembly protein n=1 Tax=Parasphingomonas caseinilytica TaxID=3096158 RepID=UPI002FC74D4B
MVSPNFTRSILIASALAPALLLGACGTTNRGLEPAHQPVVSRTDYVFDVGSAGNRLAPGESQRLAGWMAGLRLGYGDRVSVDDPAGASNGVRDDVQTQLSRYGLLVADNAPPTNSPIAPGTVRVVVSRMKATVPGCPDYSRVSGIEFDSNTSSNHGCAMNANFAAMVANPGDLVLGQPGADATDTATAAKAVDVYRKAAPGKGSK